MNDTIFEQKITSAFAALPPADVYLKNRLLRLPEENTKPVRRVSPKRLIPLAAALAVVVVVGIVVTQLGIIKPPTPIDLPLIPYNGILNNDNSMGCGMGAVWSTSAAEIHRDSPAFGRESELGTMPVYRNPYFDREQQIDEAAAMEIAEQFGRAMGKTYSYAPPNWLTPERLEQLREKLRAVGETEEEIETAIREQFKQSTWEFQCGDETLIVEGSLFGCVRLSVPLPASLPTNVEPATRYEAICQQVYNSYAAGIEALTGLRYNRVSTAVTGFSTSEYNYGGKTFDTFFYVNNPGDSLAKQAEDYALKRVGVCLYEDVDISSASLGFYLTHLGTDDLIGSYPVMDAESAKRELLAGRYEAVPEVTKEMLARATIEDVELFYSNSPWLSTFMPIYHFSVLFAPEDMPEYPRAVEFGMRSYYDFYVPAVPAEYLVPQETFGDMAMLG